MAFVYEKTDFEEVSAFYPLLSPVIGLKFNDSNLENKCNELSSDLVRLQDHEKRPSEPEAEDKDLIKLSQDGLDENQVTECINTLNSTYQSETIMHEICRIRPLENPSPLMTFTDIYIAHHIPRDWFLPNQSYYNGVLFSGWGRNIAVGERNYLQKLIKDNKEISTINDDFSQESVLEVINGIRKNGFQPNVIFTPIEQHTKMHHWSGKAHVKYSELTPRPRLISSLFLDSLKLKIVPSPELKDMLLVCSSKAITWNVKRYPEYGSLFIAFGNHRLYPLKLVEIFAKTTINCEMVSKGISILKFSEL